MASGKNFSQSGVPDASGMKFAVARSLWNNEITSSLLEGCLGALRKYGAQEKNIRVVEVSGAFELPLGAQIIMELMKPDAVICLGCVIKGETNHNEYINHAVAGGLMQLSLKYTKPFIFGVITAGTENQAAERAGGKQGNKGEEAAISAIRMVELNRRKP